MKNLNDIRSYELIDELERRKGLEWDAQVTITPEADAVKPIKPTLEDLLADCEALNDEIARLSEIARRAQRREYDAVKRCEELEALLRLANGTARI